MTINVAPSIININITAAIVAAIHDNHYDMINSTTNYNMGMTIAATPSL
jgi:hypothetical protein